MRLQLSEAAAQRDVVVFGQRLPSKKQQGRRVEGLFDRGEGLVAERLGEIDIKHFRAEAFTQWAKL